MIIDTVNQDEFVQAFDRMNRADNFTPIARRALFDYLDELSDDIGEPLELDVIALCCEYSEHTADELLSEYGEGPLRRAPHQYIYTVDLDERGEYCASIYELPGDIDREPAPVAVVTGPMFADGGELEGIDATDHEGQIYELTGNALATVVADEDEAETEGETLEDLLERLHDETTVIEVGPYRGEKTWIIGEF